MFYSTQKRVGMFCQLFAFRFKSSARAEDPIKYFLIVDEAIKHS